MKKLVKLLIPSIAVMLVAIISLTGATFAWFQKGESATVSDIEASVVNAEGILVSWDAQTWKSNLKFSDAEYATFDRGTNPTASGYTDLYTTDPASGGLVFQFKPLSTCIETITAAGELKFFDANVVDGKITQITDAENANNTRKYVKYDLYFAVNDPTTKINLKNIEISSNTGGAEPLDTIGMASRVAFVNHGSWERNTDPALIRVGKADSYAQTADKNCAEGQVLIYEPNATKHSADGEYYYTGVRPFDTITSEVFPYTAVKAATNSGEVNETTPLYPYNKNETATDNDGIKVSFEDNTIAQKYLTEITTVTESDDMNLILTEGINKVSVYVWVEGQDADCTNALAGTTFTIKMKFDQVKEAE